MRNKIARRLRQRRQVRAFNQAYDNASPSMQHELMSAAARSSVMGR